MQKDLTLKIKSLGFSIENKNSNISTKEVFDKFISSSTRVYHGTDYSRQILISDDVDYYSGIALTFRNQKKNCKSTFTGGKFQLKVEDLKGDEKLVSFNFFCIKKSTLKGLYMYHHGSCSLNGLFSNLQTVSNEHIRKKNEDEIKTLGEKPKQKDVARINKKYNERFLFNVITSKKNIAVLLAEFKKIKSATFRFSFIDFKSGPMTALEPFANSTDVSFNIESNERGKTHALANKLSDVFSNAGNILKAKVIAIDHSDNERIIDFINCPTFFDEYDFDVLADNVDGLTNDNYVKNPIIAIIKEQITADKNKNVFN